MSERERADAVYSALLTRVGEQWIEPRVQRTQRLLDLLDNPQRTYRVIHVTGTNGKSSTARIAESLVRSLGLRTGLFTSPHLTRFTERIVVDGAPVTDAAVAEAWEEIEPFVSLVDAELEAVGDAPLTFFELLTVLAFVVFADAPIDVLVLEVGMGGAWDSTNTADGDVAVFTPIDLDHADRLGSTIREIATVKSGIIKQGAAVVSARQQPEALAVLRRAADAASATLAVEGDAFALDSHTLAVGGQMVTVRGLSGSFDELFVPLLGRHQGENTALAIAAVESLVGTLSPEVVEAGLAEASSPGRLHVVGAHPLVVVDAAHNPHGIRALVAALPEAFDVAEWAVVLGVLSDKDALGMAEALRPLPGRVFATAVDSDRTADPEALADLAEAHGRNVTVHPSLEDAADAAREWAAGSASRGVLITGSVVLAGEALRLAELEGWRDGGDA